MMDFKTAWDYVGGLSKPSKMPCFGYSIPAKNCRLGSLLRKVKNSVCSYCYAMKGMYVFPVVKAALAKRLKAMDKPLWENAMIIVLNTKVKNGFFRFFDSGDIQSIEHLNKIANVAKALPHIKFWLPTRELPTVLEFLKSNQKPENLTIRISATLIDRTPDMTVLNKWGIVGSAVSSKGDFTCPASKQENFCGECRMCWDNKVKIVTYKKH